MYIDVLDIPKFLDRYLGIIWGTAMVTLPLVFVGAIVTEQMKAAQHESAQFHKVIWNTVLIVLLSLIYRLVFMKIVAFAEGISMAIISIDDWLTYNATINAAQEAIGGVSVFNLDIKDILLYVSLAVCLVIEEIFKFVRFLFLSVLYLVGPVVLVFSIYKPARSLFQGWLLSVVQVSFWIVIFRIFQAVILSFQVEQQIREGNFVVTLVTTLALIISSISAPAFTSKLFSGQCIGLLGSAVILGLGSIAKGIAGAAGPVLARTTPIRQTAETVSTVFNTPLGQFHTIPRRVAEIWGYKPKETTEDNKGERTR